MKLNITLIVLFLLATCNRKQNNYEAALLECGTEQDKVYDLTYEFFQKDDSLFLNTRIILSGIEMSEKLIEQRIKLLNIFFKETKINLVVTEIVRLPLIPLEDEKSKEAVRILESYFKKPQNSLRESYHIKDYRNWSQVHKDENFINIFIFEDAKGYAPGMAESIPSNSIAIQKSFFLNPYYYTLEHEIAHAIGGLYHTHENDHTNGLSNMYGDKVRDTYKSVPDLYLYVDNGCNFKPVPGVPIENTNVLVTNVMSYTTYECRNGFTPVQIMRMLNTIEISSEIRRTIIRKENKKVETWDLLKNHYQ